MVAKWNLFDPNTNETYVFEVNPNEGGTPGITKKIEYQAPTSPAGPLVMFEGRDDPRKLEFSGVILSQTQLADMLTWFNKRYKLRLTDDLGRQFWVYLTTFEPTRERRVSHPWKHNYKATAAVVQ